MMDPAELARHRRRRQMLESPEVARRVEELLQGLDVRVFREEWQLVTIVNEAKEIALGIALHGDDPEEGRVRLAAFYERKRRFFLDQD